MDNLLNDVGQRGMARAYVADPPLVRIHEARFPSQIEAVEAAGEAAGGGGGERGGALR